MFPQTLLNGSPLASYLTLTGGTLLGDLTAQNITIAASKKITSASSSDLRLNAPTGQKISLRINDSEISSIDSTGINLTSLTSSSSMSFNVASSSTFTWKVNSSEMMRLSSTGGLTLGGYTTDPGAGNIGLDNTNSIKVNVNGTLRSVLQYVNASTALQLGSASIVDCYFDTGNVGAFYWRVNGSTQQMVLSGSLLRTTVPLGLGGSPDSKAMLDVQSTTKGVILCKMSTTQRDAISSPTEGLEIYNTTTHTKDIYNGTAWKSVTMA